LKQGDTTVRIALRAEYFPVLAEVPHIARHDDSISCRCHRRIALRTHPMLQIDDVLSLNFIEMALTPAWQEVIMQEGLIGIPGALGIFISSYGN
ncbi:MAG: hypothetical protein RL563_2832, partial [Pseudomonadota bacterium]